MNSSEHGDTTMLGKEHKHDVKEEEVEPPRAGESLEAAQNQTSVKWSTELCPSNKRARVSGKMSDESGRFEPLCLSTAGEKREASRLSYRKPLFSISHRILEKRSASSSEEHAQLNFTNILLQSQTNSNENGSSEVSTPMTDASDEGSPKPSNLYPLIEKMFFILNTLNSSMTQLHSKVDVLTLEVMRIKKQIKPAELVSDFQPPPEYLLTREELNQLMEQTSNAGELGCRLLVHLFPELFKARECSHECVASRRALESLHLQLIRNYVEVCYPSVKNNNAWQDECLVQINDFFNRFWAQRDMESTRLLSKQTIIGTTPKVECPQTYHFINKQGQEEHLSLDNHQSSQALSGLALNIQATEELDEFSSPEDFVLFLLRRLFPEVFEEGKMPEHATGCTSMGQLILDSDKMKIIRRYMEANFPDVPEENWLQVCVQHMEDALESPHSNGSEADNLMDDLTCFSEDGSNIRVPEVFDLERCSRKSKKSLLPPFDFDNLEIPLPSFPVPQEHVLSVEQLKSNYECSLSVGNYASRLLVLLFPELFTQENTRKQYNCSGSLGKKQLDPVRVNLLRHYVQLVYPPARNDRVWILEFVGKLDERCRRRDTEQRKSYVQQRKVNGQDLEQDFLCQMNPEILREEPDIPSISPEKSNKDFCKIPLDELTVSVPDFPVPAGFLLSSVEVREVVQQSLSVGNFAARLLVRLFPELFTQENLRLQYNHSGACNKKQLDPVRLRLIRHYVETVFPVEKMEEVWHYECVPSIDERCRRPNRKKCDILKKAKRSSTAS